MPPVSTPPGWYDDGSGAQRWWDGTRWAEQPPPPPAYPAGGQPGPPAPGGRRTGLVVGLVVALVALVAAIVVILVLVLSGDDDREDDGDGERRDSDDTPSETVTSPSREPVSDLPTDASEDDFCAAMQVTGEELLEQLGQPGDATVDFGVAIEVLRASGTPADIPDDARTGFEAVVEAMEDGDGLTVDEFEEQDEAELEGEEAFSEYYTDTCSGI